MGCGHSSPSPPVSYTVVRTSKSKKRLFTVPKLSESAWMPAGTALSFKSFWFRGRQWELNLYPSGYSDADYARDFIAVFVHGDYGYDANSTKISIEILDARQERAVFDTARSEQTGLNTLYNTMLGLGPDMGYVQFVRRKELEASDCVRADGSFTVRCTVSIDEEVAYSLDFAK